MATGAVKGINQNVNNQRTIDNIMGSLNRVMIILIGLAALLALVVIYNLSNINIEEHKVPCDIVLHILAAIALAKFPTINVTIIRIDADVSIV